MKKCNQCGQEIESSAKFCRYCGGNEFTDAPQSNIVQASSERAVHKKNGKKPLIICIFSLFLVAAIAICAMLYINKKDDKGEIPSNGDLVAEKAQEKEKTNDETDKKQEKEPAEELLKSSPRKEKSTIIENMSTAERREVNIFLSNFSETAYMRRSGNSADGKITFAYYHNLINNRNFTPYADGAYRGISAELLDKTLNRFFGQGISHIGTDNLEQWSYSGGIYKFIPENNDLPTHFSIAYEMTENADGTYNVSFDVFDYAETNLKENDVYALTNKDATDKFRLLYNGSAVLKEKIYNGKKTYEIVEYTI